MYAFLDKRPAQLPLTPRIVLTGLRLWASAMRSRQCAAEPLSALFQHWKLQDALWPTHNLFIWISAKARRNLTLGCPACGMVSEDEALLLCAIFPAANNDNGAAEAALIDLVADDAVAHASRLAHKLQEELTRLQGSLSSHPDDKSGSSMHPNDSA